MLLRAGSHHHSMGGKDPQVHEFVGFYSDPQCDAGSITAVVFICVLQIEPTSEQVSQTVLQVSQTVLHVSQTVLRWSWLAYSDPQCDAGTITAVVTYVFFRLNLLLNKFRGQCYKFRRQCYKFRRQCYDGVGWPTATLNATQGLSRR